MAHISPIVENQSMEVYNPINMAEHEQNKPSYPEVLVLSITEQDGKLLVGDNQLGVDLGGAHNLRAALLEAQLNPLMNTLKESSEELYLLSWQGNKVPRGVMLQDMEIGWTQNGVVISTEGNVMGYYDRIVEFGGENKRDQQMVVYMRKQKPPTK